MDYRILNQSTFDAAASAIKKAGYAGYFVHSDMLRGLQIKVSPFSAEALISAHVDALQRLIGFVPLWMPTFALDFPKSKIFDLENTPSEMGHISEYFRKNIAQWRSPIPMHSCCGTGNMPSIANEQPLDPWSTQGIFGQLAQLNFGILFYGAGIEAVSLIHFLEKQCMVPYRYEKIFEGQYVAEGKNPKQVQVSHIVRPAAYDVGYDWQKIMRDLDEKNLVQHLGDTRTRLLLLDTKGTIDFWTKQLENDPFYLVDENTKEWALPLFHKLGRPFNISDFEKS